MKRSEEVWASAFVRPDYKSEKDRLARMKLMDKWQADPWEYLTGKDIDGTPTIWTVDELDDNTPVKPFPDKPYLKELVQELWGNRIVFLHKSRQMYVSTLCCLLIDWYCTFTPDREVIVSKVKEENSIKLITDKIRKPYRRKPQWMRDYTRMSMTPEKVITYGCTQSTVTAVAQNFALTDSRGITASIVLVDEAAFQDYLPQIYRAVLPMANRFWAVTTPNIGNPGASLFHELVTEGVDEWSKDSQATPPPEESELSDSTGAPTPIVT